MSNPIRANGKPKSSMKIDNAPTPHNTPASVLNTSYLKNGVPTAGGSATTASQQRVPQTIEEGEDEQEQRAALASALLAQKPLLLQSIQDKLDDLVGADSGYVEALPRDVRDRVYSLGALQTQLFDIEKNFQVEMFELEDKYNKLYRPLMERRAAIVAGSQQPSADEIKQGRELAGEEDEEEQEEEEEQDDDVRGVPAFWLTALENLPIVNETITDRDAEVLEHLENIAMEYISEGQPGFKLTFTFGEGAREFFANTTVTKTYYYQSELGYSGDFVYDHAESEPLQWTDAAHNVTVTVEERKQRNKATKQVRTVERLTPCESFFNFFDPPSAAAVQALQDAAAGVAGGDAGEALDEDAEETEARLALDYSMGEQLKDKLIPRAVDWFTGAALEFEFADGELPEDDEDDSDADDADYIDEADEDDAEEDDDNDDFAQTEQAPECKQS